MNFQKNILYEEQQSFELVEQLKYEDDFLEYIKLLQHFARNYVVMLVSCDTPWGPNLTKEMTLALKKLGLTVDLFAKFRYSYAAAIDAGLLVFEKLSPSEKESVERNITMGEDKIDLFSAGFDTPQGKDAYVKINGKVVSTRARGLNFVVYDKEKKQVLDAVNFDVFGDEFIGKHLFGREKLVQDYLEEHPGTTLLCFNTPTFPQNSLTLNENFIHQNNLNITKILANLDKSLFAVNRYYDAKGVAEVLTMPNEIMRANGVRCMADKNGELVNIVDGHRITELQPQCKKRTIFLLGEENVFGVGVSDIHTMASFLQALFDQNMPEEEIVVENYGRYFKTATKPREWAEILQTLPVCPSGGDIVLWNTNKISGVPFINMANAAAEPRNADLFLDKEHYTPHGHKLIADKLYEGILEQELSKELKQETEYFSYLDKLRAIKEKYTIIVVSCRTPVGKFFGAERCDALRRSLGLNIELTPKRNHAYAAIVDSETVLFEEVSSEPGGMVVQEVGLNGTKIAVRSLGNRIKDKEETCIKINDVCYKHYARGLFFLVCNKESGTVLDTVTFDVETKQCVHKRNSEEEEQLLRYVKTHPHVVVVGYGDVLFPSENFTKNELHILKKGMNYSRIAENITDSEYALHKYYSAEEIAEVCTIPKSYHDKKGVRHFFDIIGNCVNIVGGHRVTMFQPKNPKRTIFLVGGCNTFGVCDADAHTMASRLQEFFNQNYAEEAVCVQNYGYFLEQGDDKQSNERLKILESLPVKPGDIVLVDRFVPNSQFITGRKLAMEPRSFEVFVDKAHLTPDGQRLWAEKLYEGLVKYDILSMAKEAEKRTPPVKSPADFLDENDTGELAEYKRTLIDFYNQLSASTDGASEQAVFGSIVMNCNPFTKGHRYLIDQALTHCDYLVVFVVEEDKSIFPFEDRFRLVVEGTEDLPNVIIIPSGRFIISSLTFSEYFNKSELQDRVVDTSMDVLMFVREIAPCLRITKRFAGEEPFDAVTRQYNESMKKILPEYGMEFVEIPRAGVDGEVISASRVRALLEKKEFEAIEKLVPETTYRYLVEKFG